VKEPSLKQGEKAMDHMDVEIKSEACEKYNRSRIIGLRLTIQKITER